MGYVAPEVLRKQPYTFSCDVWSLGCIIYALLSGSLPFDHESQKETIRMTLEDKLVFDLPVWDDVSTQAKDLVKKLLTKDQRQRISLADAIAHPWFNQARQKYATLADSQKSVPLQQKKSSFANRTPAAAANAANNNNVLD